MHAAYTEADFAERNDQALVVVDVERELRELRETGFSFSRPERETKVTQGSRFLEFFPGKINYTLLKVLNANERRHGIYLLFLRVSNFSKMQLQMHL